jgi:hypothetical protein
MKIYENQGEAIWVPLQVLKTNGRVEVQLHLLSTLTLEWESGRLHASAILTTPLPPLPLGYDHQYPFRRGRVGPKPGFDAVERRRTLVFTRNRKKTPWSSYPWPSHYTNWAISIPSMLLRRKGSICQEETSTSVVAIWCLIITFRQERVCGRSKCFFTRRLAGPWSLLHTADSTCTGDDHTVLAGSCLLCCTLHRDTWRS